MEADKSIGVQMLEQEVVDCCAQSAYGVDLKDLILVAITWSLG